MPRHLGAWLFSACALFACGDNLPAAPKLEIIAPERGQMSTETTVLLEGRATPGFFPVARVDVNGQNVELDGSGHFAVELDMEPGTHRIVTQAIGTSGGITRDVRAVSVGTRAGDGAIDAGAVVSMGTVGLGRVASLRVLPAIDMDPVYQQVASTAIADVGAGCDHDIISVSAIEAPMASVALYGLLDGLGGEVLFSPIETTMSADYTDSQCNPATGTFQFNTLELHLTFQVDIQLDGELTLTVDNEARLYDHDLIVENVDIEDTVFPRVSAAIETRLADALVPASIDEYRARVLQWIESFEAVRSGSSIELASSLAQVTSGSSGVSLALDLEASGVQPGAWVPTPEPPVALTSRRAAVALADDAVDQVLGAAWAAGDFDSAMGGRQLELRVPPSVSGTAMEIGDWIVSGGGGTIAVSGSVPLEAASDDTVVGLVAGECELEAQIIDGTPGDLDTVLADACEVLTTQSTEALKVLDIPIGEAVAPSLGLSARDGYLVIDTSIPPSPAM